MFAMGPAFLGAAASYATLALTGTYPAATVGVPYSQTLAIAGGLSPYSLTGGTGVSSGSLPAGLALSIVGSTLVLSGTPTTAATATFTASVGSTDGQTATSAQSIVVSSAQSAFSATNIASDIVLSNGNNSVGSTLTTQTGGVALSNTGKTTGKFYFEMGMTSTLAHGNAVYMGLHRGTAALTTQLGNDTSGWASIMQGAGGNTRATAFNSVVTNSSTNTTTTPNASRMAVDVGAGKLWLSVPGSTAWAGGGDPASGTSPTYTFTPGTDTFYFAACPRSNGNVITIIDPASWASAAPSGFGVWT